MGGRILIHLYQGGFHDFLATVRRTVGSREADGLAMSSRNRHLSAEDHVRGLSLSRALRESLRARTAAEAEKIMGEILEQGGVETEYAVVRDAETLMPMGDALRPMRALIAARVGSVRLIDNGAWAAWDAT